MRKDMRTNQVLSSSGPSQLNGNWNRIILQLIPFLFWLHFTTYIYPTRSGKSCSEIDQAFIVYFF
jgi:hypothetical protein